MEQSNRTRIRNFLLIALAVAAAGQFVNRYVLDGSPDESPANSKVSKGDIRRGIAIPLALGLEMAESGASFIDRFGKLNANLVVIDVPLTVRKGNPAYLEFNRMQYGSITEMINNIHEAGFEVALNPVLTGQTGLLSDISSVTAVYGMFEEWLEAASATRADMLYIYPLAFHEYVPASSVQGTIESLYESYTGSLYMHILDTEIPLVKLYQPRVRGFVVHGGKESGMNLPAFQTDSAVAGTPLLLDFHEPERFSPAMFEPYIKQEYVCRKPDPGSYAASVDGYERAAWFAGVILPSPGSKRDQTGIDNTYSDFVGEWFTSLKRISQERAFERAAAALRRQSGELSQ